MSFHAITPQKVQHASGYIVQVADRYSVDCIEAGLTWRITVDFGQSVGLYKQSIRCFDAAGKAVLFDSAAADAAAQKIAQGLQAMGSKTEWC